MCREAERILKDEARVAVVLGNPGRDDVGLKKLRDFFEDFRRHLRNIELVDQGAGDLVERRLSLKDESL